MRVACWIHKATNTHSEDVILITFPLQQWLYERTPRVTLYIHYLVIETERVLCCVIAETEGTLLKRLNNVLDRHIPDTRPVTNGESEILTGR